MKAGRRHRSIPKQQEEAEKLYLKGARKTTIARNVEVSLMTIYRWAKQNKWEEKYRKLYKKELDDIKDEIDRMIFINTHRTPRIK